MEIHQLEYFVTIVNEGSISAAARKLNLSQPPLSLQVRHLEEELGVVLFTRGARQITLTAEGRALYRYAVEILDLERSAADDIRSMKSRNSAALRMGMISSCHCPRLYGAIARLHDQNPSISFRIREGNTFELLELLRKGRIELAVIREPFSEDGLQRVLIREDHIVAAMSEKCMAEAFPEYASSFRQTAGRPEGRFRMPPFSIKNLQKVPLVIYRRWEEVIRTEFARQRVIPTILCVCDDARTCLRWAEEGFGAALAPASILEDSSRLLYAPLAEDTLSTAMSIVWRSSHTLSPEARLLIRSLRAEKA